MGTNAIYLFFTIGMIFILAFVGNSTFIERRANFFYSGAIIVNISSYLGYIGRAVFEQYQMVFLANVAEIVIYAGSPLMAFFLLICTGKKNGVIYKVALVGQIMYTILCVSSVFTGWFFVVDEFGKYSRGPVTVLAFAYAGVLELVWVISLLVEYKTVVIKEKLQIISVALIELIAIAIQVVDSSYKYSILGSSFLLILFYIFQIEIECKYDKMTKIFNQRYYSIVTDELSNNYSIIVLDINGLKAVNDNLGHEYGDKLIKAVADSLQKGAGESGKAFRIGGDEFAIIVKDTKKEKIDSIIRNIRLYFQLKESELSMEVSASIGTAINTNEMDFVNLFRIADADMYKDKSEYYTRTGKDRRVNRRASDMKPESSQSEQQA